MQYRRFSGALAVTPSGPLIAAGAFAALCLAGSASAATTVLTFDGNICSGGAACANESAIDQSYGDTTGVDVQYRSAENATGVTVEPLLRFWAGSYGDLLNVAYANPPGSVFGEIVLSAAAGYEVSLTSYDFATYLGRVNTAPVSIQSLGGTNISSGNVSTNWPTHNSVSVNSAYFSDGIRFRFGPDSWNTGIDNFTFDVRAVSEPPSGAVPEPATWAMMLAGFFSLGSVVRGRRKRELRAAA